MELLLIGRDPDSLSKHFPNHTVCGYDTLETMATGFDALLHLAVLNNDVAASEAEFMAVNVDHLLEVLDRSRMAGVPRFINVSSIHALRPGRSDFYSVSKRVAAERLRDSEDVVTLYMPLLYGNRWGGRLAPLNRLPRPLARLLFLGLASLKPVAHVEALAAQVMKIDWTDRELIIADGQRRNPVFQIAKRAIDLIFAIMVLVLLWWALIAVWAVVRCHGPGLFAQTRVGKEGRKFTCLKFRTMALGIAEVGTHDIPRDAITPIGYVLRRTKIDELPQVLNILKHEISVVGPRPCLPVQTELVDTRRRRGVFGSMPGITGLAQVNGADMSDPEALRDGTHTTYLAMQTLPLDIRIMLGTLESPRQRIERFVPGAVSPLAGCGPSARITRQR